MTAVTSAVTNSSEIYLSNVCIRCLLINGSWLVHSKAAAVVAYWAINEGAWVAELGKAFFNYSKALRYTASSCTDLDNAHFWIGSKKNWDAWIYVVKTLSCTVYWGLCLIKNRSQVILTSTEPNIFRMLFSIKNQKIMML